MNDAPASNRPTGTADAVGLLKEVRPDMTYRELDAVVRKHKRVAAAHRQPAGGKVIRIAIAGDATTNYVAAPLPLLLEARGIDAVLHHVPYASLEAEVLREGSELARWRPDLLIVMQTPLAIKDWPEEFEGAQAVEAFVAAKVGHVLTLCGRARERFGCEVIVDNWHTLPLRPHGSLGRRMPGERNSVIRRMNAELDLRAPDGVRIHDVEGLSSLVGSRRWVDWRLWFHAKQPMSFESIVPYGFSYAAAIASSYRGDVKCIAVDLDNTLWGGVIGDDGIGGIHFQQGDPQGEAFQEFQQYLARLKARGLILAVCSKNEPENARLPFEQPGMVLRLDDFAAFKANWLPKSENIRAIAAELNIGLDAIVFVDDNPVERGLVRSALPNVKVVEMPEDPADYPAALDKTGWFEVARISSEDLQRTQQYLDNAKRQELAESVTDYESYLRTLEQCAYIGDFLPEQIERITQLVNKTNQFNLTTQRVGTGDIQALAGRDDVLRVAVRLTDKFGDNGLIAVLYGAFREDEFLITQWLMSCRVFNRGVEQMTMNHVVARCRERDVRRIIGEYRATKKNVVVKDLYERLGFARDRAENPSGADVQFWALELSRYEDLPHSIEVNVYGSESK